MRRQAGPHLRLRSLLPIALCLWGWTTSAQWTNAAHSIEELRAQIQAHVTEPRFNRALWSIQIASLDTGQTIFEHHPHRLMSPASNSKLYTGALALDHLGGDYRITTPIYMTAIPSRSGKLRGDVIVVGRGDPSWRLGGDVTNFWELMDPFVAVLTNAGIRRVMGDIVADATFLQGPPSGASWTVDDMNYYYGAEISAITLNDNTVELRVTPGPKEGQPCHLEFLQPLSGLTIHNRTTTTTNGGSAFIDTRRIPGETSVYVFGQMPLGADSQIEDVPVPLPATWFASALKEALARSGIQVRGEARSARWPEPSPLPADAVLVGAVASPPMREMVRDFMTRSQNLETDLIFNHIGETTRSSETLPWRTSEELAVQALETFLRTNGLPVEDLHFDEGSGLSRNNLTSAALTFALLRFMVTRPASNDFWNALPVAGVDGTLRRRMKESPAEGNLRAKTGTLRWANALSGYVTSAAQERFVFSLMLNRNVAPRDRNGRQELDDIALMLARFSRRSDTTLESLYAPQGRLILVPLVNAPFPHPARAAGHTYRGKYFTAADHYCDSTVALFVPRGFRETEDVDFVIHFHGWNNSVARALGQYQLIEQFVASERNAVLVVPEGPENASDSFGGKLEDAGGFQRFMDEVLATLQAVGAVTNPEARIGDVILSGHSGGYHVISAILDGGGLTPQVREVWLFDALYGGTETFLTWQATQNGRLLTLYTDGGGTTEEVQRATNMLRDGGVRFERTEDSKIASPELLTNRVVFLHSDLGHNEVVAKRNSFRQFLQTSCLEPR